MTGVQTCALPISGLLQVCGVTDEQMVDVITVIDKFKKLTKEEIIKEFLACGITMEQIEKLYEYFQTALSEREQKIICMRYGLDGKKEYTQKEIAGMLGISRSYVSRIEKKALEKLLRCFKLDEAVCG